MAITTKRTRRLFAICAVAAFLSLAVPAVQGQDPARLSLGGELQVYPAGLIPGLQVRWAVSPKDLLTFRLGYNVTDRRDWGEHDDETGGGPGFGLGYRRFFRGDRSGWYAGARLDLWTLEIDWRDDLGTAQETAGASEVLVLQPTVEGGHGFRLGERWRLDAGISLGAEVNVHTEGEEVGEGAILLGGATVVYNF